MLFHKFDEQTKIFIESVELEEQPENSTDKNLPEITEYYTVAFIDNEWVSVLKPEFEIVNNEIKKIEVKQQIIEDKIEIKQEE